MAMMYDPASKTWYDDEGGDPWSEGMFSGQMFLPGMEADRNKYGLEPYEQADINQALTGVDKVADLMVSPGFNQMVALSDPSAGTFDWGGLTPGGGMTGTGMGYGAGTAGYGTGGGGGGGMGGMGMGMYTPTLTSSLTSPDPYLSDFAQRLAQGESPYQLQIELNDPSSGITNERMLDTYNSAIGRMAGEMQTAQSQMMGQQQQAGPLAQWYAKTGQPDPNQLYSADMLPGDTNINQYLKPYQHYEEDDQRLQQLLKDAVYANVPQASATPGRAAGVPNGFSGGTPGRIDDGIERRSIKYGLTIGEDGRPVDKEMDFGEATRAVMKNGDLSGPEKLEALSKGGLRDLFSKDPQPTVAESSPTYINPSTGAPSALWGSAPGGTVDTGERQPGAPSSLGGRGPTAPGRTPRRSAFGNMFGVEDPDAVDLSATPYALAAQGNAKGDNFWGGGKAPQRMTNQAGRDAEAQKRATKRHREYDAQSTAQLRQLIANHLQEQGRTPAGDQQAAKLRALRNMGVRI